VESYVLRYRHEALRDEFDCVGVGDDAVEGGAARCLGRAHDAGDGGGSMSDHDDIGRDPATGFTGEPERVWMACSCGARIERLAASQPPRAS
jgi:hypothetical protein